MQALEYLYKLEGMDICSCCLGIHNIHSFFISYLQRFAREGKGARVRFNIPFIYAIIVP